jgi:hypothetical protein
LLFEQSIFQCDEHQTVKNNATKNSWRKKIAILGRQSVLITGAAKSRYGESNIVVF